MPLSYVLRRVQSSAGISSPDLNPEQRSFLLDYINEACEEIWESTDLPVALQEVYCNVIPDFRVALPPFVGEVRAMRNRQWDGLVSLANIRARYVVEDWPQKWLNSRIIGESPIANEITNAAPVRILYPASDTDLQVTIVGVTSNSNRAVDVITMNNTLMNGTKSFIEITKISKNKITDFNVVIQDASGNELGIIYADQLESRYVIMDVSKYPNIQCSCGDNTYIMEVLFKPRLPKMVNNTDEFPVSGYDNIIVLRTQQLLTEQQEGKEQRALLMYEKSKVKLKEKMLDKTGTQQARITVKRNKLFGMFRPYRYGHNQGGMDSF